MNARTPKTEERGKRRRLDWLLNDWVWEVCLFVIVTPVVIDQFLALGGGVGA